MLTHHIVGAGDGRIWSLAYGWIIWYLHTVATGTVGIGDTAEASCAADRTGRSTVRVHFVAITDTVAAADADTTDTRSGGAVTVQCTVAR